MDSFDTNAGCAKIANPGWQVRRPPARDLAFPIAREARPVELGQTQMSKWKSWRSGLPLTLDALERGKKALRARGMPSQRWLSSRFVMGTPAVPKSAHSKQALCEKCSVGTAICAKRKYRSFCWKWRHDIHSKREKPSGLEASCGRGIGRRAHRYRVPREVLGGFEVRHCAVLVEPKDPTGRNAVAPPASGREYCIIGTKYSQNGFLDRRKQKNTKESTDSEKRHVPDAERVGRVAGTQMTHVARQARHKNHTWR